MGAARGDCLAVPPARPCARLSVWGCRLALRRVVGPADAPQIGGRRPGRSDLRPPCNYIYLTETVPFIRERHTGEQRHTPTMANWTSSWAQRVFPFLATLTKMDR